MKFTTTASVRRGSYASVLARLCLPAVLFAVCWTCGVASAADNLTIDGGAVETWNGETKSYGTLTIGTQSGSGSLVAVDSSITLSSHLYVGYQSAAGDVETATLFLTNTAVSCSNFTLGYNVSPGPSISAEIGPGSVVTCVRVYRYCSPSPTLTFAGGRIVFNGTDDSGIFRARGHTWDNKWPNGGIEIRGAGHPIDVEVPDLRKLVDGTAARSVSLCGDGGFVKRGVGTLVWGWHTTGNDGYVGGTVDYTGDTVIKAGGIRLATPSAVAESQIACRIPSASPLVIEEGAFFDFAGNDAAWVSVSGDGILTNSSVTSATLTLGTGNADCSLEAAAAIGVINAVKNGTGTLTVDVPVLEGSMTVAKGTLKVKRGTSFTVGSITAVSGTTLDFRGATVRCGGLTMPADVTILRDADTDFSYTLNTDLATRLVTGTLPARGDFTKAGPGTLTLVGPCAKTSGSINVGEGAVVCEAAQPFSGKFFRLKYGRAVKESEGWDNDNKTVQFSEFSLYGVGGGRINEGGFTYAPITGTATLPYGGYDGIADAKMLSEREVAVWMPTHDQFFNYDTNAKYDGSPLGAFDGSLTTKLRNTSYWEASTIIVFRMEDAAEDAIGFTFTTSDIPLRRPNEWTLEGSVDGTTWTTIASRVADSSLSDEEKWLWRTNSTPDTARTEYNGGFPYTFDSLALADGYAPFGAASVSVASGATLTLGTEMTVAALRVDMSAGAGSILGGFTPAENGILYLDNVAGGKISDAVNLPLTVAAVDNATRLKSWAVHVNGEPVDVLRVRWNGTCLVVVPRPGLILSFR